MKFKLNNDLDDFTYEVEPKNLILVSNFLTQTQVSALYNNAVSNNNWSLLSSNINPNAEFDEFVDYVRTSEESDDIPLFEFNISTKHPSKCNCIRCDFKNFFKSEKIKLYLEKLTSTKLNNCKSLC